MVTLLTLVFGAIFLVVVLALGNLVISEYRLGNLTRVRMKAFAVAEAGLEYYRWHLYHFPDDLKNGTNGNGPYAVNIPDPFGAVAGTASLSITGNQSCGQTLSVDITSTGTATDDPSAQITLLARFARPTVASFSYIVNESVWAGADRVINGPYHSNGGVRMDGSTNAPVTSAVASWLCTASYGCNPNAQKNGVFGAGNSQNLWQFPVPQVDFTGIAADFNSLKTTAQTKGVYLPRYSSGNSNAASYHRGYHLIFNADGSITVRKVSTATALQVTPLNSSDPQTDYALIGVENFFNTYQIPAGCTLIFVEDNTWVEGTIPKKVTLVVANTVNAGVSPDVFLRGNISYTVADGSVGFTLIAEHNILITPDAPQNMVLNGVFIAQDGAFGRNYYACPSQYEPRASLTIVGSTVSNKRTGTKWLNGCGNGDAGYQQRTDSFDRGQVNNPPPFTPATSNSYKFVDWQQLH